MLPYTIQCIVDQIRMYRMGSAFIQNGVDLKKSCWLCPEQEGECRPSVPSKFDTTHGVQFRVGLEFPVNGKRGQRWMQTVCYEANDTYTVYFTGCKKGVYFLIESASDVYCDSLNDVLVRMYDDAIPLLRA